ncbi:unnamed protein product [Symbiodinium sp. CCMP2456]|nr:unnamed protein product [Symbiodinium sp. CCMP2456]
MAPHVCLVPALLAAIVSGPVYVVAESCTTGGSGKGLALVQRARLLRTKFAAEHEELEEHDRAGIPLRGMHRSHDEGRHDDMGDLLQSLVATAVREGRNLTPVERQAFDDMKAVLENTTVAKLQDAATADQQSLHDIAQAMEDCGLNLTSQNTTLQLQKSLAVAAHDAYMEASLAANSTAVVLAEREVAMSTFMAESPQPTVATNQSHSPELVSEVRRLVEWATDYLQHADALEAASNESDTLLDNRTAQQELWEEAYCAWLAQKELMLTSYNLCWQASAQSYNSTLLGVQANTEARRLALSTILKLTCLVDVISSPTQEQEAKLNVCETQDYNTSDIDVAEPVLPEKTDLSSATQFPLEVDFDCAPPTTTSAATVATTTTTAAATTTTTSTTTVLPHIVFSDTNGGRLIRCWAPFDGTDGSCEELISRGWSGPYRQEVQPRRKLQCRRRREWCGFPNCYNPELAQGRRH